MVRNNLQYKADFEITILKKIKNSLEMDINYFWWKTNTNTFKSPYLVNSPN